MGCIIQVVGKKDTGKTSAIERAVKILKEKGYSVAVVKHSHHEIDIQGKDTYRFWEAGSDIVIFNDSKCVMFYRCNLNLLYLLPVDIILVEGYKDLELGKKIEIHNPTEVDEISRKIVSEAENCNKECNLIINGKKVECDDPLTVLLYNLLNYLKIRELKIES
ncbi:molybdopterin-guanine dinucleotide biosynthesis protein B [Sulfurisphaera tokodaii]|uniref:Molybdopterin-guanine dinucleotide biosynthesis protein MobB n=2 Tax=Sulfurisphaera tokodaii TaxID=111955 RepID=Q96YY6_SULTO|nr:molybdopterin-guanine dinucleotide biosynthesis protein B [Sulfurisphaera tokodaii]BAB67140.1 putative molybdopterin-guanine dinucleotide biosynthesis protein MobB [Sulfurisphaera tokodaii str. 7]HII72874.1 molybdopterin-guanine dinucleotide biosynthesis protein B [Sulfurisphaera tokodaii]